MTLLVAGLALFAWLHSLRIVAEHWRQAQIQRFGRLAWTAWHALMSIAALGLIIGGYAQSRQSGSALWVPPPGARAWTMVFTSLAFALMATQLFAKSRIRRALGYPFALGLALWAAAHLLSNGRPGDVVLFLGFLAWALFIFIAARRKGLVAQGAAPARVSWLWDGLAASLGIALAIVFAMYLHEPLIGVAPWVGVLRVHITML